MKRRITSIAMTAMLGLSQMMAQNGQFDPYFTTLPTETGKGVVTSLNYYNGGNNWTGFLGIPGVGSTMGKTTWGRLNNPWDGGYGRVWLECVDGEKGLYVLAAQGHYVIGFNDNGNGKAVSIVGDVGDKEKALKFTVRLKSEAEGVVDANEYPEYEFKTEDGKWIIQGMNNRVNNLTAVSATTVDAETGEVTPTVETGSWQIGTWQGVGFVRLDVKMWDGPSGGGGTLCADGYYYGTLCLPYEVQVPDGNLFPDGTAIPNIVYGDRLVQAWSILDGEDASEFDLKELKPGDVVPAGSLLLVKAKAGNVDFLINPGSGYVATPDKDNLAVGYYATPNLNEVFHLHIADGYPKFMKGKMTVNEIYQTPVQFTIDDYGNVTANAEIIGGTEGGHSQPNKNIGYITITDENSKFTEYRLDTEKGKLVGYDHPDYAKLAQRDIPRWITDDKLDQPFFNASADKAALEATLNAFTGDKTLEEYNALKTEFTSKVIMPEKVYTTLMIDGNSYECMMVGGEGLVADGDWPWERTGTRVYMEKVSGNQYKLGLNGKWVADAATAVDGVVAAGAEAGVYTVTVVEPGKITFTTSDGKALLGDGTVQVGDLMVKDESGNMVENEKAIWHVDNSRPWMQFYANIRIGDRYYTSVCVPYRLGPNPMTVESGGWMEPEGLDTELYEVKQTADGELELVRVDELPAGMPGIISGSTDFIKVGIVGTDYATAPIALAGDYTLRGCFADVPAEGSVQNMHILGTTVAPGETVTKLGLVAGTLDGTDLRQINKAYYESPTAASIAFVMPEDFWSNYAENVLGDYIDAANLDGAFQLTTAQAETFKPKIPLAVDEAGCNALAAEMVAAIALPESFYGALKTNRGQYPSKYMGYSNRDDEVGLYSNSNSYRDANYCIVLKKVEGGYTVGINGAYIQAPVDGEQAVLGAEPAVFDVTVAAPGQIKISKDGVYLVDAVGVVKGGVGDGTAIWTVDNRTTDFVSVNIEFGGKRFGAITLPFDVSVDKSKNAGANLWTLSYDAEKDSVVMIAVDVLPAGTPGIVSSYFFYRTVTLNVLGGWAESQPFDATEMGFKGIFNTKPKEGTETVNSYVLGMDAQGRLSMVKSTAFDPNRMFLEAPATADADGDGYIALSNIPVDKYEVTFTIEGEEFQKDSVFYSAIIVTPEVPEKEGYTFSGWSEVPEYMPANDLTLNGTYTVNKYKLVYTVDGEEYKSAEVEYGAAITLEAAPEKEGHTFSGWSEVPETMPAKDVAVEGKFTVNTYKLTYMVDGKVYMSSYVTYGEPVFAMTPPVKEGYSFSGWSETPETMPAKDVTIEGTFTVNTYKLTYVVDGEVYMTSYVTYGDAIFPMAPPVKEGYVFSGWSEIPETMPANDVTVEGSFAVNGIEEIFTDSEKVDVYTLQGVMIRQQAVIEEVVRELPKGIYIINGKKVVVK